MYSHTHIFKGDIFTYSLGLIVMQLFTGDLLAYTSTGQESLTAAYSRQTGETPVHVIFIHPLQNGLFRLVVRGPPLRLTFIISNSLFRLIFKRPRFRFIYIK